MDAHHFTIWEIPKGICLGGYDGICAFPRHGISPSRKGCVPGQSLGDIQYMHKMIQLMRAHYNSVGEISPGVDSNKNAASVRVPNSI